MVLDRFTIRQQITLFFASAVIGVSLILSVVFWCVYQDDSVIKDIDEIRAVQVDFVTQVQEWKNTIIRGHVPQDYKEYYGRFKSKYQSIQQDLMKLAKYYEDKKGYEQVSKQLYSLLTFHKGLYDRYTEGLKLYEQGVIPSTQKVDNFVRGIDRSLTKNLTKLVGDISHIHLEQKQQADKSSKIFFSIFALILLGGFSWLGWTISSYMYKYNETIKLHAGFVQNGELNHQVTQNQGDYSILYSAFNGLYSKLGGLIKQIISKTSTVSSEMQYVSKEVTETKANLQNQKVKMDDLAKSMYEFSEKLQEVNQNAAQTKDHSEEMEKCIESVSQVIKNLAHTSNVMEEKLQLIDKVSKHVGLLSLNASIEAARAGDAGRGFAVVAEEIRKLAKNANEASTQIKSIMQELLDSSSVANDSIDHVFSIIKQVADKSIEVSGAVDRQNEDLQDVNLVVADVVQQLGITVDHMQNMTNSVDKAASNTQELTQSMKAFKVK
jgi:methyl-accepting chemotaxis protein